MLGRETQHPFPDYVTCPHCGEPEVEVWCYAAAVRCHACGRAFEHALPQACEGRYDHATCELVNAHGSTIKISEAS